MPYSHNPRLDPNIDKLVRHFVGLPHSMGSGDANTGNWTSHNNQTIFSYIGKAPKYYTKGSTFRVKAIIEVSLWFGIWGEVAVYTGAVNFTEGTSPIPPTLTRVGLLDVSAIADTTGIKTFDITLSENIPARTGLWIAMGSNSSTSSPFAIRYGNTDYINLGLNWKDTFRPSTGSVIYTPVNFSQNGLNTYPIWFI